MKTAIADTFSALFTVGSGLVVGIVLFEHVIILPLVCSQEPGRGVATLQFVAARAWRLGPTFGVTAGLSGVSLLALWPWHAFPTAAAFTLGGVVVFLGGGVVTFALYYPADAGFRGLSAETAPAAGPAALARLVRRNASVSRSTRPGSHSSLSAGC
ncbi:MAG: hypothetical protein WAQ33_04765 [Gaiellaceae bacterium]